MEERPERSELPETAPAALLLLPPSLPPAPPGTGAPPPPPPSAPRPGGEGDDRFLKEILEAMNGLAVMRTTFETLDCFPEDEALTAEMRPILAGARNEVLQKLRLLNWRCVAQEDGYDDLSMGAFRCRMERLAAEGVATRWGDSLLKLDVFHKPKRGQTEPPRRYWFMRGRYDAEEWNSLPNNLYAARLLIELVEALDSDEVLEDRDAFEDVFRDYLVLVLALYLRAGPMFHPHNRED